MEDFHARLASFIADRKISKRKAAALLGENERELYRWTSTKIPFTPSPAIIERVLKKIEALEAKNPISEAPPTEEPQESPPEPITEPEQPSTDTEPQVEESPPEPQPPERDPETPRDESETVSEAPADLTPLEPETVEPESPPEPIQPAPPPRPKIQLNDTVPGNLPRQDLGSGLRHYGR